jgi:hypothetical protein
LGSIAHLCETKKMRPARYEKGRNEREHANSAKWITTDESRVAGWYHSVMTIGPPEPKPI